ncbi:MAG: RidA family protein [Candidatus Baltobacteraceae bacterium]
MSRVIEPEDWPRPSGYSNGIAASGEQLFIAGQVGWNERHEFVSDDFAGQAAQALRNVTAVVQAAGGAPCDVVRMTWYVTDIREYQAALKEVGAAFRALFGAHYPAMTLVQVPSLLEDRAKVEIEATAVLRR